MNNSYIFKSPIGLLKIEEEDSKIIGLFFTTKRNEFSAITEIYATIPIYSMKHIIN